MIGECKYCQRKHTEFSCQTIDPLTKVIDLAPLATDQYERWALDELIRWAEIGAALEQLPKNDSIKHVGLVGLEPADHEWIAVHYVGARTPKSVLLRRYSA